MKLTLLSTRVSQTLRRRALGSSCIIVQPPLSSSSVRSFSTLLGRQSWPETRSSSRDATNTHNNSSSFPHIYSAKIPLSTHVRFSTNHHDSDDDDSHQHHRHRRNNIVRDRAEHLRDAARQNYKDFRENPRSRTVAASAHSAKLMLKQYGPVFVGTYMSVYFGTLGALFAGVESGLLDPAGLFTMLGHASTEGAAQGETINTVKLVVDFMSNHAYLEPYAHYFERNPQVANLAVAWIAVKFTEPVRLAVSVAITPKLARYFGYAEKKMGKKVVVEEEQDDNVDVEVEVEAGKDDEAKKRR